MCLILVGVDLVEQKRISDVKGNMGANLATTGPRRFPPCIYLVHPRRALSTKIFLKKYSERTVDNTTRLRPYIYL
jgi:hypothetical protein